MNKARQTVIDAIYDYNAALVGTALNPQHVVGLADQVLQALENAGYTIMRPVTAEEEAANEW